jgi:hypothetical protein
LLAFAPSSTLVRVKTPSDPPPKGVYRTPGERPPDSLGGTFRQPAWLKGVVIAVIIALGVPAAMLIALFILIIGVCAHGR